MLAELVTNAVTHVLRTKENAQVVVSACSTKEFLEIIVKDNGAGLPEGRLRNGLGTHIVGSLVQGELGGKIAWSSKPSQGTEVVITVPTLLSRKKS